MLSSAEVAKVNSCYCYITLRSNC